MKKKKLGNSSLEISEIGLGCMGMSEFYGATNDVNSLATLDRALELGINFFDTADVYGMGHNEELLGKAVKGRREKFIIATKFGIVRDKNQPAKRGFSGRPEYVKACCDASLSRLGIDVIDLYYQHRVDKNVPIEETVGAMAELVKAGKVRYLGLSEASVETIKKAVKVHPISALQSEYSLWTREPERAILPLCRELGITFVAYSPIGRGFLTGALKNIEALDNNDFRLISPRFQGENFDKNLELVNLLEEFSRRKNCTPAQLALAWMLNKDDNIVPIPGTKRIKYLEENAGAAEITLTEAEIKELDERFSPESVSGTRYPEEGMKSVNV
jgi:aryl-alcohol dehydrogenase-like predicted oxidoreductase